MERLRFFGRVSVSSLASCSGAASVRAALDGFDACDALGRPRFRLVVASACIRESREITSQREFYDWLKRASKISLLTMAGLLCGIVRMATQAFVVHPLDVLIDILWWGRLNWRGTSFNATLVCTYILPTLYRFISPTRTGSLAAMMYLKGRLSFLALVFKQNEISYTGDIVRHEDTCYSAEFARIQRTCRWSVWRSTVNLYQQLQRTLGKRQTIGVRQAPEARPGKLEATSSRVEMGKPGSELLGKARPTGIRKLPESPPPSGSGFALKEKDTPSQTSIPRSLILLIIHLSHLLLPFSSYTLPFAL